MSIHEYIYLVYTEPMNYLLTMALSMRMCEHVWLRQYPMHALTREE
jgi:hypothetical protein